MTVYTNRPAGGSFRGLGAPLEVLIDQIAAALGVDPLDYRLQHHVTSAGQPRPAPDPLTRYCRITRRRRGAILQQRFA